MKLNDTIIQLSTNPGPAAIHILRISGTKTIQFLQKFLKKKPVPRRVYNAKFFDNNQIVDQVLFFYFKKPRSYSGEDMAEIHCHGSMLIVKQIMECAVHEGIRPAEKGEFSRRACINNKMTVYQAEAVNELIKSKNNLRSKAALNLLFKKNPETLSIIKNSLTQVYSCLEAALEFPEDIFEKQARTKACKELNILQKHLHKILFQYRQLKVIENGINIVIAGRPNAGKSTLMNLFLNKERVLVSSSAGTTRDFITEPLFINNFSATLTDTAGIRNSSNKIEQLSIKKSIAVIQKAQIVVFLLFSKNCINEFLKLQKSLPGKLFFLYINKSDILNKTIITGICGQLKIKNLKLNGIISLKDPAALILIKKHLIKAFKKFFPFTPEQISLINNRQAYIIDFILKQIQNIKQMFNRQISAEIICEEIKLILTKSDEIDISVNNNEIIDKIFADFCIGK
ncbi:MAG: tRNA uridine-5-carboxymethylaminomethyl(34) synthesis GTPase MnmE [Spirochaetes bacterium GWF1_41_5]|nr:MAG: tRNA uridine-5-carboxymethylaminomethyl(34) synthesis GTPase MnmE [Spirochaetes bacterium GWF1_41_5]